MINILICDIEISGHHSEYINHLVDYLCDNPDEKKYFFLLHPYFQQKFKNIIIKIENSDNIEAIFISKEELYYCSRQNLFIKSLEYYRLMNKYATKLSIHHVILLYFNIFQFALGFYKSNYSLSGILFYPFYKRKINSLKEKFKYYQKYILMRFSLRNNKIKEIFILNDEETAQYFNCMFHTQIFKILPDPIPKIEPKDGFNINKEYGIESSRKIFLHFGSLSERKGTLDILHAIPLIDKERQKEICFLFVGETYGLFSEVFLRTVNYYINNSFVQIINDNRFVENSVMKSLFNQCDFVLIPYKNTESSSGVLGHAVASGKPVIGSDSGLLGQLIKENGLGVVINGIEDLSNCIVSFLSNKNNVKYINNPFLFQRTTYNFAKKILS